jgi:hypothetical protein
MNTFVVSFVELLMQSSIMWLLELLSLKFRNVYERTGIQGLLWGSTLFFYIFYRKDVGGSIEYCKFVTN